MAYVEVHDSDVYAYRVPPVVFEELAAAESKGAFLNTAIKPRFPFRKVGS